MHMGLDSYLLAQQMDGHISSLESLRTSSWFRLAEIPYADKALRNLGTFAFFASQLLSTVRRHVAKVEYLLHLIKRLKELNTNVQGMITPPHISITLMFDVSRQWILYLKRYMDASSSYELGAPRVMVPFTLEPILLELEGGIYMGSILPVDLAELVSGQCSTDGGSGGVRVGRS